MMHNLSDYWRMHHIQLLAPITMSINNENNEDPVKFLKEKDILGLDKSGPNRPLSQTETEVNSNDETNKIITPKRKNPLVASFLTLLMLGLGHLYAGKIKKAIFIYLGLILIALSIRFLAFNFYIFAFIIVTIILYYIYAIVDSYILVKRNTNLKQKKYDKWYLYLLIIILQATLLEIIPKSEFDRITPINFATIPTTSMTPTLEVGDFLAIQRTKNIKQNDVIIFKYPEDTNTLFIFRCIGLPGDNLTIKNNLAYINKKLIDNTEKIKFKYFITTTGNSLNERFFSRHNITDHYQIDDYTYQVFLTKEEAQEFKKISAIKINPNSSEESEDYSSMLFQTLDSIWTVQNYGPIYIPKKGESIKLTPKNIKLYESIIRSENTTVTNPIDKIDSYTFKSNYYFVLGDNRDNALDSRFWGFVKDNLIIGKGLYFNWAKNTNRIGLEIK